MRFSCCITLAMFLTATAIAQVPVVGGSGATLRDIAGTETMVTIVLKGTGAEDPNQRVKSAQGGYLTVVNAEGEENFYLLSDVLEIRVQGGEVKTEPFALPGSKGLTSDQKQVVGRAVAKTRAVFDASDQNLTLKMQAAMLLIVGDDGEHQEIGRKELMDYTEGNDLSTALRAARALFIAGDPEPARSLVGPGLDSENWRTRSLAATLAGFVGEKDDTILLALNDMLRDRSGDSSAPALQALARLGVRDVIPSAIAMLDDRKDKAEAAVFALSHLGGEDIIQQMKVLAQGEESGLVRFRAIRVLWALDDPLGEELLRDEMMEIPTLRVDSAILLASEGDVKATSVLRERLSRRYDLVESTLTLRAEMATALLMGGDRTEIGVLQELLRSKMPTVEKYVCELLPKTGIQGLIAILQPTIESNDHEVALAACHAVLALSHEEFRERVNMEFRLRRDFGVGPV
jgi:HEAT repeat protein